MRPWCATILEALRSDLILKLAKSSVFVSLGGYHHAVPLKCSEDKPTDSPKYSGRTSCIRSEYMGQCIIIHQIHHTKQSDHQASTFTFKQIYLTDTITDILYYMEVPRTSWFLSRLHHSGVWHDPFTIGEQIVSKWFFIKGIEIL